jgi:hypothetical protein
MVICSAGCRKKAVLKVSETPLVSILQLKYNIKMITDNVVHGQIFCVFGLPVSKLLASNNEISDDVKSVFKVCCPFSLKAVHYVGR